MADNTRCWSRVLVFISLIFLLLWMNSTLMRDSSTGLTTSLRRSVPLCNTSLVLEVDVASNQKTTEQIQSAKEKQQKTTSKPTKFRPTYPIIETSETSPFDGIQPRAFAALGKPIPCYPNEPDWDVYYPQGQKVLKEGFFFHKPYKTGSSTAAGIHLQMAFNEARRQNLEEGKHCRSRFDHAYAPTMFGQRDRDKSFLWTIFRDPTSRIVSEFFHMQVSRAKEEPSDKAFKTFIRKDSWSQRPYSDQSAPSGTKATIAETGNAVMQDYDFIAITERWDESMAVLTLLLDVPVRDVVHVSAKGAGGYDDGGGRGPPKVCTYIVPSFVSESMRDFFMSKEWQDMVRAEYQIYRAANASLDRTIDALGPDVVEARLRDYRALQAKVKDACTHNTMFPCDPSGVFHKETDCLWNDSGCGHECINRLAAAEGF